MHYLASSFSFYSLQFQIVSNKVKMHHLLSMISIFFTAVPNSFECRKNAPFSVLVFKSVSAVSNAIRMHHLLSLFSKLCLQFQIVSNAVRMYHLLSLFSKLCLPFQMPPECTIYRPCFQTFRCSSNSFQILSWCKNTRSILFLTFQISISNSVRMFHYTVNVFKIMRWGRPTPHNTKS